MRHKVWIIVFCAVLPGAAPLAAQTKWSDRFAGADAGGFLSIGPDEHVLLDTCTVDMGYLTVKGRLQVHNDLAIKCPDVQLTARSIRVMGQQALFEIGSPELPYPGGLTITLTGDIHGIKNGEAEQRQLMVMSGGRLEFHGASGLKQSWTQLAQTADVGDDRIRVASTPGWAAGDVIVIASTSVDPRDAEVRTITSVMSDGREFALDASLNHHHFGRKQSFGGKVIDTRAEVGLLSHSIVIQGDASSDETGIGGNLMIMNDAMDRPESSPQTLLRPTYAGNPSVARMSGVEFFRMGQRGRAGRYPLHWHLVDDGSASYVRNSSIRHGLQRGVVIHGTDEVLIEGVVAYHIPNHVFVPSEEGDEVRNRFIGNLGILGLPVSSEHFAFPQSDKPHRSSQSEHRAAIFWLRNSYNVVHDNHAAGSYLGQGFFLEHGGMNKRSLRYARSAAGEQEICDFRNNLSHSNYAGLGSPDLYPPLVRGFGLFTHRHDIDMGDGRKTFCSFNGFQSYKNQHGGIWTEHGTIIHDAIVSDSHVAIAGGHRIHDVVLVGQSENIEKGHSEHPHPDRSRGGIKQGTHAGNNIANRYFTSITCVNLPSCFMARANGDGVIFQYEGARIDDVRLIRTPQGFGSSAGPVRFSDNSRATMQFGGYTDEDGALTGVAGQAGLLNDKHFLRLHHAKDNAFGWEWDSTLMPSESLFTDKLFRDDWWSPTID